MRKLLLGLILLLAGFNIPTYANTANLNKIDHIIVIYLENHSFDNLYGLFPGADGIQGLSKQQYQQLDNNGKPLTQLPPVWKTGGHDEIDPQFAGKPPLSDKPFQLNAAPYNVSLSTPTRDLVHHFYVNQGQIDHGKNDGFAAQSEAGGLVMGYYDGSGMKLWQLAKQYTLADHFFMGAFGGSFLNHFWLICACTPQFPDAPGREIAELKKDGVTLKRSFFSASSALFAPPTWKQEGSVSPDFYAIATEQPAYQPSRIPPAPNGDLRFADPAKQPLPPQTTKTIGEALTEKGISWAWYTNNFYKAEAAFSKAPVKGEKRGLPDYTTHHHPFNYFKNYAPGTQARALHFKDLQDLLTGIKNGDLPQVVFYKPDGKFSQHPGSDNITDGDEHVANIVAQIQNSSLWKNSLIIITYDENGGFWDHVPPPKGDRWGPGMRVPAIFISPYVKKGFIDHTNYDTTSILKLITLRFNLEPLPGIRANMGDLTNALM